MGLKLENFLLQNKSETLTKWSLVACRLDCFHPFHFLLLCSLLFVSAVVLGLLSVPAMYQLKCRSQVEVVVEFINVQVNFKFTVKVKVGVKVFVKVKINVKV